MLGDKEKRIVNQKPSLGNRENVENGGLYQTLSDILTDFNRIPVNRRLRKGDVLSRKDTFETRKGKSKFKLGTSVEVSLGRPLSGEEVRQGIKNVMFTISTGDMNMFGESKYSYRVIVSKTQLGIGLTLGRGIFSRTDFDYPEDLSVFVSSDGKKEVKFIGAAEKEDSQVKRASVDVLENVVFEVLPILTEGYLKSLGVQTERGSKGTLGKVASFVNGRPQEIDEALAKIEDLHAKGPYDSDMQVLWQIQNDRLRDDED